MIIGINALHIRWGVNAGTETYFTNIVRPWYEKYNGGVKFVMYCNNPPPWWKGETESFKIKIIKWTRKLGYRLFIEQIIFPFTLSNQIEVLFNPGYVCSLHLKVPQVTTIHDGFAWVFPNEIGRARSLYWRGLIPYSARISKIVIAVSNSTADDIVKFCKISKEKIRIIYEGGSHLNEHCTNSSFLIKYKLQSKGFYHCVGIFKDIKNPINILNAFCQFKVNYPSSTKKLVLAGHASSERAKEILEFAKSIRDVICLGRIDDSELAELYRNSSGLIFPSLYEGFGIPILEAQAFGCPVVTSNVSSMPEVAGKGSISVDPRFVEEIANAFVRLENEDVKNLIKNGYENLTRFSWNTASVDTLRVLCEAGDNK